jgi:hypothetical protein
LRKCLAQKPELLQDELTTPFASIRMPVFPRFKGTNIRKTALLLIAFAVFGANKAFATDKSWIGGRLAARQPGTSPPIGALAPLED